MIRQLGTCLFGMFAAATGSAVGGLEGDPHRGADAFGQCLACHSLEPGRHLTGPSLAGVVGRRAGTAEGFVRYSHELISSGLTWDPGTLDQWLVDPEKLVPGTSMRVRPVADADMRRDLIAFLEEGIQESDSPASGTSSQGGMMGGRRLNLKEQRPGAQVKDIRYCGDAYWVTVATGNTYTFWEFNLRFKTDSSADGPPPDAPAIVGAGMMGDRAFVVFADPTEISTFIRKECPDG